LRLAGFASFRAAVAANYKSEYGIDISADNVVAGPGAKVFEQFFCEAFLDPGDCRAGVQSAFSDLWPQHRAARRTMVFSSSAGEPFPARPQ